MSWPSLHLQCRVVVVKEGDLDSMIEDSCQEMDFEDDPSASAGKYDLKSN